MYPTILAYSVILLIIMSFFSLFIFPLSAQIGVTASLLTTTVGIISVNQTWTQEWDIIPISLQVRHKIPKAFVDD